MSATLWKPQFASYKEALEAAGALTIDDVREALPSVSPKVLRFLSGGPGGGRFSCAICKAFGERWFTEPGNWSLENPAFVVWVYHEAPKAQMTRTSQLHYGELANETYRRCLETYRAAGWEGEASEPDA